MNAMHLSCIRHESEHIFQFRFRCGRHVQYCISKSPPLYMILLPGNISWKGSTRPHMTCLTSSLITFVCIQETLLRMKRRRMDGSRLPRLNGAIRRLPCNLVLGLLECCDYAFLTVQSAMIHKTC